LNFFIFDHLVWPERWLTSAKINEKFTEKLVTSTDSHCCQGNIVPNGEDDDASPGNSSAAWRWELGILISGCILALFVLVWIYFKSGVAGMSMCVNLHDRWERS
jgi:hypothetical protein